MNKDKEEIIKSLLSHLADLTDEIRAWDNRPELRIPFETTRINAKVAVQLDLLIRRLASQYFGNGVDIGALLDQYKEELKQNE